MALVAYDYDSDSENEDEEVSTEIDPQVQIPPKNGIKTSEISDEEDEILPNSTVTSSSMFDKLPQKKEVIQEVYEDKVEDFIPKAEVKTKKSKVKISIPSLSDYDNLSNEEPVFKKLKPSPKGSGLLSMLPPVKSVPMSNKSFIPNVLAQKTKTQVKKPAKPLIPQSVMKNKKEIKLKQPKSTESDDSDDDVELPETFDEELWKISCGKTVKKDIIEDEPPVEEQLIINIAPEAVKPYEGLDNTAFKELVGKSSKMPRNIKLVDVNEAELVSETDLWMTKSLTDPNYIPKKAAEDEDESVDPTKRKKHHITYLAQQAKANEQELQNQWSSSKFNRNQTRAKYGF